MEPVSDESIARMWRDHAGHLQAYLNHERAENSRLKVELDATRKDLAAARAEIARLDAQAGELRSALAATPAGPGVPAFVKPNVPDKRRRKPGRPKGHPAALRPMPGRIDRVVDVPLAKDDKGRELCPKCRGVLTGTRGHERVVEDLTPVSVEVVKYRTRSGDCLQCDCRRESRAPEQPPAPAGDLPHGQVGLNALAMGVMLRVRHRLPLRQVRLVFADMAGLGIGAAALVKQVARIGKWLDGEHEQLLLKMRASGVIHVDETGWRVGGRNAWAWVFTQPLLTVYLADGSRGGKVAEGALGEAFGGTVVSDFYSAYNGLAAAGGKQRCLAHLLREIKDLGAEDAAFGADPWVARIGRWCKDAMGLKRKWGEVEEEKYELRVSRAEDRLEELIRTEPGHAEARRLRKRLEKHRKELTTFLWRREVEPTNNPAERALRPLVIARKITGGHRSEAHMAAWMKLASLLRTQEQNGQNVLEATRKLLVDYWATAGR